MRMLMKEGCEPWAPELMGPPRSHLIALFFFIKESPLRDHMLLYVVTSLE